MSSAENDEGEHDHRSAAGGGAMRGIIMSLSRVKGAAARVIIGRLPRKPPQLRAIGTHADRLANVVDVLGVIKDEGSQTRHLPSLVKAALPAVAKSVMSGTVLFLTYDEVSKRLQHNHLSTAPHAPASHAPQDPSPALHPLSAIARAAGAGCVAGSAHACVSLTWDALLTRSARSLRGRVSGTLLSHAVAHTALFGSYEALKVTMLAAMAPGRTPQLEAAESRAPVAVYAHVLAVIFAGAGAGAIQEGASALAARRAEGEPATEAEKQVAREGGRRRGRMLLRAVHELKVLPWRSMVWAAPASALGFVAYEFADADAFA